MRRYRFALAVASACPFGGAVRAQVTAAAAKSPVRAHARESSHTPPCVKDASRIPLCRSAPAGRPTTRSGSQPCGHPFFNWKKP